MAKDFSKGFYKSKAWLKCREGFIQSKFGLCERCKKLGHIVHHKIKLTSDNIDNPEITLSWDNLEYLCLECHNSEHTGSTPLRDGLTFNEYGDLIKK